MNPTNRVCAHCGALLSTNQLFCVHCGTRASSTEQPVNVAPSMTAAVSTKSGPAAQTSPGAVPSRPAGPLPPPVQQPRKRNVWKIIGICLLVYAILGAIAIKPIDPFHSKVLLPPATGTPLFTATFADNSQQWPIIVTSTFGSQIKDGRLVLTRAVNDRFFLLALPGGQSYSDFRLDMTFLFQQGDAEDDLGLNFRSPDDAPDRAVRGYVFVFNRAGTYQFIKGLAPDPGSQDASKAVSLGSSTLAASLAQGQPIALSVITKGSTMAFYINHAFVVAFTDATYTTGAIDIVLDKKSSSQSMEAAI